MGATGSGTTVRGWADPSAPWGQSIDDICARWPRRSRDRRVIERDSSYAEPYSGLADAYLTAVALWWARDWRSARAESMVSRDDLTGAGHALAHRRREAAARGPHRRSVHVRVSQEDPGASGATTDGERRQRNRVDAPGGRATRHVRVVDVRR